MLLQIASNVESLPAPPNRTWQFIRGLFLLLAILAIAVWAGFRWLKRTDDPVDLIVKWIISAVMLVLLVWKVVPIALGAPFVGVPLAAGWGVAFAILWRHELGGLVANPIGNMFDGGNVAVEPRPLYSIAVAKRKRGLYPEAIADIRQQLEKFPDDFDGHFLIAEIFAENLNDLHGADIAIQRICNLKGRPPGSIAMALNALADWQMKYAQDRDAAKETLERIIERLPDSEFSAMASQRIAHLATAEHMLGTHDQRRIVVKEGVQDMGLISREQHFKAPEADPAKEAADYVRHLEMHPLDTEAREKLAVLYANHFDRLDLAVDQLEQLIADPHQPASRVVHWFNLLADLQIQHGATYETVHATLQRIVDRFPTAGAADVARNRLAHLKLEFRKRETSQTVKLGTYEQDLGLKQRDP